MTKKDYDKTNSTAKNKEKKEPKTKNKFPLKKVLISIGFLLIISSVSYTIYFLTTTLDFATQEVDRLFQSEQKLSSENTDLKKSLEQATRAYEDYKKIDQVLRNDNLEASISAVETTYQESIDTYEDLVKLKEIADDTEDLDNLYTQSILFLTQRNYSSASAQLVKLSKNIKVQRQKIISTFTIPKNIAQSNDAPSNGYSRQRVSTSVGEFMVDIVAGDLGSTRVIVDTASDGTCTNDCPVLSLGDYVSRNGAYAGINGSYFCPTSYPSCAGKTNSFDTLLMNKNKVYFNSDNNVYSTVPAVIFGGGWVRFVGRSQEWGRDTGIDSMIANQPLLVSGGNNVFGGDGDPKKGSKAGRSFVANKGNTIYIGVVYNSTVAEAAHVLSAMGMENGLNLDSGGSTAFWSGGYKAGPGRNIPNAILFVRK